MSNSPSIVIREDTDGLKLILKYSEDVFVSQQYVNNITLRFDSGMPSSFFPVDDMQGYWGASDNFIISLLLQMEWKCRHTMNRLMVTRLPLCFLGSGHVT